MRPVARSARVWNPATMTEVRRHSYEGDGWGLCFDGKRFIRSDGSSTLHIHDRETFKEIGTIDVTLLGKPLAELNELECMDDEIYANVWFTAEIVRIDARSGEVTTVIDARSLAKLNPRQHADDVLNGIAYDHRTGHFVVTGKRWRHLYEIEIAPLPDR
ncbi:glutaminyl-peptide cyclotransferase [Sorangium sp. So ce1151]|uniref:glutaminyl-peptide cyclotransferase n=1 Tax=Sorangium sp. So ce1151 TaxID=3133332 RepID=UPI003F6287E1